MTPIPIITSSPRNGCKARVKTNPGDDLVQGRRGSYLLVFFLVLKFVFAAGGISSDKSHLDYIEIGICQPI